MRMPSEAFLCGAKERLRYEAETGELFWKVSLGGVIIGSKAGSVNYKGARCVAINKEIHGSHQIIWDLYMNRTQARIGQRAQCVEQIKSVGRAVLNAMADDASVLAPSGCDRAGLCGGIRPRGSWSVPFARRPRSQPGEHARIGNEQRDRLALRGRRCLLIRRSTARELSGFSLSRGRMTLV